MQSTETRPVWIGRFRRTRRIYVRIFSSLLVLHHLHDTLKILVRLVCTFFFLMMSRFLGDFLSHKKSQKVTE